MSYILEALKKSEQERELGRVPGLVTAQESGRTTRRPRWVWLVAFVLVLNGLLLSVLLLRKDDSEPVALTDTVVSPAVVASPEKPVRPRLEESRRPEAPVEMLPDAAVTEGVASAEPQPPETVAVPAGVPVAVSTPAPAGVVEDEPASRPGTVIFAERPLDEVDDTPPDEVVATRPAPAPEEAAPLWRELPVDVRANLPQIALDVHVYAEEPRERFVLVNLRRYREGDTLEEGPRLEAITPEGVVLSSRGRRFRIEKQ